MNNRVHSTLQRMKSPFNPHKEKKMEVQGKKLQAAEKSTANQRQARRERKMALLQDVDKLKKKLRHEENVHRALERAFSRPLGALPRLPAYLPRHTLELLAEVAVLEEEVVWLEEQVVSFRQSLYLVAVNASSPRQTDNSRDSYNDLFRRFRKGHSRSSSQTEISSVSFVERSLPSFSRSASSRRQLYFDPVTPFFDRIGHCSNSSMNGKPALKKSISFLEDGRGKENQSCSNSTKTRQSPEKSIIFRTPNPIKSPPSIPE